MEKRTLGTGAAQLEVSALGLGCMGFSQSYPPYVPEEEAIAVIERAIDLGVTFFDTADVYGLGANEELLGRALAGKRDQVTLATKCGFNLNGSAKDELGRPLGICGKHDFVKDACEQSLRRLHADHIDLYYLHRVDPATPIEETAAAMQELMDEGKILHWGISEASAETVRRAHSICPLTAVQSEYSLWYREPERELLGTLEELGIGFVPFSPLGKAMLTGRFEAQTKFADDDFRSKIPRFAPENLSHNMQLVNYVAELAEAKQTTPARIALAWLLAQKPWIAPIPGTKRISRLEENAGAVDVSFTPQELSDIAAHLEAIDIQGARYPEGQEALTGL